jgi:D-glycero-alpha-D-manno-heptose 1-phosphate guanylyltransferase
MEAIILAGGKGTRLRSIVSDVPKPMAPILGRPFLSILLSSLANKGFRRAILSLGFMANHITRYFSDSFEGMSLTYVIEEEPLGTGGGIRLAMEQMNKDHVFVFNGDTFLDLEINQIEKQWQHDKKPILVTRKVADTSRYGRVEVEGHAISVFLEKGESGPGLINAGCYVLNRGLLDHFIPGLPFSFESDFLPQAIHDKQFDVFVTRGLFIDIGIPEDFLRAQTDLRPFICS